MSVDFSPLNSNPVAQDQQQKNVSNINFQPLNSNDNSNPSPSQASTVPGDNYHPIVGRVLSALGGASAVGAAIGESTADAGLWAYDKLNSSLGSDKYGLEQATSDSDRAKVNQFFNMARTNEDSPQDSLTQAANQYPYTNAAVKYGLGTAAAIGLSPASTTLEGALGTSTAARMGLMVARGAGNALEGAGMGGPNKDSSDYGAILGLASAPLGELASWGLNATKPYLVDVAGKVKDFLAPINAKLAASGVDSVSEQALRSESNYTATILKQDNSNYAALKQAPLTISGVPIQNKVAALFKNSGATFDQEGNQVMLNTVKADLEPKQINVLRSIQQDAGKLSTSTTLENAINLRQYINSNSSLFTGKGISSQLSSDYKEAKSLIDNMINNKLGGTALQGQFQEANKFHEMYTSPLRDSGATDRLHAVVQNDKRTQLLQNLKPGQPTPPINPEYTKAVNSIIPSNPTRAQLKDLLSRSDAQGSQIMQNHFVQKTLGDVLANPENFDKNATLMKLNRTLNKYDGLFSEETKKTFEGIKTVLKESGAVATNKQPNVISSYGTHFAGHMIGGAIGGAVVGGAVGAKEDGMKGAGIGTGVGAIAGIIGLPALLNSVAGQKAIRYIADRPEAARSVINAIGPGVAEHLNDKNGSNDQ